MCQAAALEALVAVAHALGEGLRTVGKEMRSAQKRFFADRTNVAALRESRRLEREWSYEK